MTPYEVYFYSSGGVEEGWTPKDLGVNRANAMIGYGLGGFLSFMLMITAARSFSPRHRARVLGTVALGAEVPLGRSACCSPSRGSCSRSAEPSIDTLLRRRLQPRAVLRLGVGPLPDQRAARHGSRWPGSVLLVLALGIVMTGVDPVMLTEYAVIFSVVALPLTYLPILLVANDRAYMGKHANGASRQRPRRRLPRDHHGGAADRDPPDDPDQRGAGMSEELDLGLAMLDHQLLDCEGRRCGNVDDLGIEGGPGEPPRSWPSSVGPGAWRGRRAGSAALPPGRRRRPRSSSVGRGCGGGVHVRLRGKRPIWTRPRRRPDPPLDRAHPGSRPMRTLSSLVGARS